MSRERDIVMSVDGIEVKVPGGPSRGNREGGL